MYSRTSSCSRVTSRPTSGSRIHVTDDEVVRAATEVGVDRIIRGFPRGYGQVLGERGASISVGERQLLSFARAVAANAPVLLLDEATSAVDSEIEAEIQRCPRHSRRGENHHRHRSPAQHHRGRPMLFCCCTMAR